MFYVLEFSSVLEIYDTEQKQESHSRGDWWTLDEINACAKRKVWHVSKCFVACSQYGNCGNCNLK